MLSSLIAAVLGFFGKFLSDYLKERRHEADVSRVREKEKAYVDIANQGGTRQSTVDAMRDGKF